MYGAMTMTHPGACPPQQMAVPMYPRPRLAPVSTWVSTCGRDGFNLRVCQDGEGAELMAAGAVSTDEDDREQLNLVCQGDKRAIGVLYNRHHKRVFLFLKTILKETEAAEDVTNEVFIEVWHKAGNFEGRSKVSSWILGMARYKALTEIRKRGRYQPGSDEIFNTIEDDADTPEVTSQKLDKSEAIKRCIASLSTDHRVMLELVYYQEKSIAEIAEILDIPKNTVKTRTFHARKLLSEKMKARGIDRGWP